MPYSNLHSLTSPPLGFTVAFSVALVWLTDNAAVVTTVGGRGVTNTNTQAAPASELSPEAPLRAVLPSEESATL